MICAGEPVPLDFARKQGDLIIAVDGGYAHLRKEGITPDLCVGDFDSLGFVPDESVIALEPIKDVTDTFFAAEEGLKRGYTEFRLYCALGGRLSHTMANIHTLAHLTRKGAHGVIAGDCGEVTVFDKTARFDQGGYLSLFPLDGNATVRIRGCKYNGMFTLTHADSLGVSNEPLENAAVDVICGEVIAITEKK